MKYNNETNKEIMAQIISIVNQKGGVGKTTTAVNLGAYLAHLGKFVLLVDMDPQANATSGLGIDHRNLEKGVYEAISGDSDFRDIIINTSVQGYKVAPATVSLAGANVELVGADRREFRLHDSLLEARNDFDYILIDCPPSLGLLTINSLTAADHVFIPVQAEYYALEGLGQLLKTIELVRGGLNPDLQVLGVLLTMYDKRNQLARGVLNEVVKNFPGRIEKLSLTDHKHE